MKLRIGINPVNLLFQRKVAWTMNASAEFKSTDSNSNCLALYSSKATGWTRKNKSDSRFIVEGLFRMWLEKIRSSIIAKIRSNIIALFHSRFPLFILWKIFTRQHSISAVPLTFISSKNILTVPTTFSRPVAPLIFELWNKFFCEKILYI